MAKIQERETMNEYPDNQIVPMEKNIMHPDYKSFGIVRYFDGSLRDYYKVMPSMAKDCLEAFVKHYENRDIPTLKMFELVVKSHYRGPEYDEHTVGLKWAEKDLNELESNRSGTTPFERRDATNTISR